MSHNRTYIPKAGDLEKKKWYVIDAEGEVLGRVAVAAARILRGKNKPQYTPFLDCGDHVIIINAAKAVVTGNKAEQKSYYRHSGYKGGLKEITYQQMMAKHPERIMYEAVRGMLPHNPLGRRLARHFRVYAGPEHPHKAQQPKDFKLR